MSVDHGSRPVLSLRVVIGMNEHKGKSRPWSWLTDLHGQEACTLPYTPAPSPATQHTGPWSSLRVQARRQGSRSWGSSHAKSQEARNQDHWCVVWGAREESRVKDSSVGLHATNRRPQCQEITAMRCMPPLCRGRCWWAWRSGHHQATPRTLGHP